MSTIESNQTAVRSYRKAGLMSRSFALVYAAVAYAIGAGSLFWFFFASVGLMPLSVGGYVAPSLAMALLVDVALVMLFAVPHSIMARSGFKAWWTTIIPTHLERSTYVLVSGVLMVLILSYWQAIPGSLWLIENEALNLGLKLFAGFGFAYLLLASFFTNHFELFGLRQAWLHATGREYSVLQFRQNWVYGFSRHPLMAGMLIVLWSTPEMTLTRFVFSLLLTIYVFAGIKYEEHSLIEEFGDTYRDYTKRVGMFFTFGK